MSRSKRKNPCITQERKDCRSLNRKIRAAKLQEMPKGGFYRKIGGGWPWKYLWTREQAMQEYKANSWLRERYSLEEWINKWERWALRK